MRIISTGWSDGFDGPGRRWVVYLKGCNFRCRWCTNPESLSSEPEILFSPDRGQFADRACRLGAVERINGLWRLDRARCSACGARPCVAQWHHPAFVFAGEDVTVAWIVERAKRSRSLWSQVGGVTFGGGEPTLQLEELTEAIDALRAEKIHVAVETNASHPSLPTLFGRLDLLICDLKCVSPKRHREWTGSDNETVLENLRRAAAAAEAMELWIRIPLVPGLNDDADERERLVNFLAELPEREPRLSIEVLRMHHLGQPKYAALSMEYPMSGAEAPSAEVARELVDRLERSGLRAALGG